MVLFFKVSNLVEKANLLYRYKLSTMKYNMMKPGKEKFRNWVDPIVNQIVV